MKIKLIKSNNKALFLRQTLLNLKWSEYVFYNDGEGFFTSKTGKGSLSKNRFYIFACKGSNDSHPYNLFFLTGKDIKGRKSKLFKLGSMTRTDFLTAFSFFKTNKYRIEYSGIDNEFTNPLTEI